MRLIKSLATAIAVASVLATAAPNVSFAGTAPPNTRTPVDPKLNQGMSVSTKVNLTSLTLKETNIPWTNPVNVKYSLSGNKPIQNCHLEYQLQTNDSGKPAVPLWPMLDLPILNSYNATLPVLDATFGFGTLELNGIQVKSGSFRVTVRAKNTPTNTCSGEVHADFMFLPKP